MAGGGDIGAQEGGKKHGKHGKKKKARRVGVRIDMTPLVDIAFLLLTFFMFSTSMSRPQTMEINLPPEDVKVEIAESNLLTLQINSEGNIFWSKGMFDTPQPLEFTRLRGLLKEQSANPKLVTVVKVDREGTYEMMVNIIDELNLANVTRFSLAPMTDKDKEVLTKLKQ
jgi:biopolymer transport protein ExbD